VTDLDDLRNGRRTRDSELGISNASCKLDLEGVGLLKVGRGCNLAAVD
jgi:hypothetical protein